MSDLKKYVAKRKAADKDFAEGYDEGYQQFKIWHHAEESKSQKRVTELHRG